MAASSSTYGTYNPGGIDPFQIESTLANIVGTNNPAQAANMLDTYQVANRTSADNYNYAMNQQHQYAQDQLAQQWKEKMVQALIDAPKTAGAIDLLAASPIGQSAVAGIDPAVLQRVAAGPTNLQRAETYEKSGAGASSYTNAGFQPTDQQAQVLSGGLAGPRTDPVAIQVERLKLAAEAQKAAQDKNTAMVTVWGKIDPDTGKQTQVNMKVPYNNPDETKRRLDVGRGLTNLQQTPGYGLPGAPAAPPPGSAPPAGGASPPPAQGGTPQQRNAAPPATPAQRPDTPTGQYEDWRTPQGAALQGNARQRFAGLPAAVQQDINTNVLPKTGGNYPIVMRGGRAYFVDSQGNMHGVSK